MTYIPIALFWGLALAAFFGPPRWLFYLLFASLPFGSFAVLPTQLTGGLTFTTGPIVALILIGRMLLTRGGVTFSIQSALLPRRMLLLFLLLIIAVTTTLFMPRLFARQIEVIPFRGILQETAPLVFTTQNLSQLVYLSVSIVVVVAFAFFLRSAALRQHALKAVCLGAAVTVATGVLDFASQYVPLGPLLAPFRTATYALAIDVQVFGGKRVVGLMPEASAFGGLCLSFLVALLFFRFAIVDRRIRQVYAPMLIVALVLMIWLAKSTGAYVGLALALALAALHWATRALAPTAAPGRGRGVIAEFWIAFGGAMGVILILIVQPALLDPIYAIIDRMVLTKAESSSYEERGMWRAVAWQAFLDSYLFGVGVGSTRSSSAVVSMFASVGLLGALCYYGFILQTVLRRAAPGDREGALIIHAFAFAILPGLVVGFFIGSADFGVFDAFLYGLVTAVGTQHLTRTVPVRPPPVMHSPSAARL